MIPPSPSSEAARQTGPQTRCRAGPPIPGAPGSSPDRRPCIRTSRHAFGEESGAGIDAQAEQQITAGRHSSAHSAAGSDAPAATATATLHKTADGEDHHVDGPQAEAGAPHLLLSFAPLLLALLMIATGAVADAADLHNRVLTFLADPVVALLAGLIGTVVIGRIRMGQKRVEDAIARGFKDSGQILILTTVGGSLAAVVAAGGLGDILRGYFGAHSFAPLLLVWAIAAVLHIAVDSVTISAITAAGILAPLAPSLGIDPVLIALAAGTGSLFAVHVTSNTFWLLQSLMGQTTRGTLKTCTIGVSLASVVGIILLQPISLLFF
ncbi:GntP family permease [Streptomyces lanatus]|uniref:GntP family permease n=1 Tax=Streptomyces lanatus TaxID=66900 RepID=A0ABV1Y281_9ACTN|nr:GntP family permease [Streptomyces lanatus]GHH25538.1 hypothetical protein GCM10018780_77570 [Streptomyces lanatus]